MKPETRELNVSKIENLELFLLNLRYKEGRLVEVEGNKPLLLNDPTQAWIVYSGVADVFSAPVSQGEVVGVNRHLFRGGVGQLLLGVDTNAYGGGLALRVSGTPGTRLLRLRRARLMDLAQDLEFSALIVAMLEDWVGGLANGIFREVVPKEALSLEANQSLTLDDQATIVPRRGILWVQADGGALQLMGQPQLSWQNGVGHVPISRQTWARVESRSIVYSLDTPAFIQSDKDWQALDHFHQLALQAMLLSRAEERQGDVERLQRKAGLEQATMQQSLQHLTSPLSGEDEWTAPGQAGQVEPDYLFVACRLVAEQLGVTLERPPAANRKLLQGQALQRLVRHAGLLMRDVALRGSWWENDNGPLLGFLQRGQRPVALLRARGRYELVNPVTRTRTPVDAQTAATVLPVAYTFYRPFPNKPLGLWEVLRFGVRGGQSDVRGIILLSAAISLIGLLPPVAMGWLFNTVIPSAQVNLLWQVGVGLIVMAVATAFLRLARGIAFLRVQTRLDADVQAALWSRLLSLPMGFFRDYTAGDLGTRAMGISTIRRALSGYVVTTLVTSLFSITNLLLLFAYSTRLALTAMGLVVLSLVVTVAVSLIYLRYQRESAGVQGKVAGTVLQLLTGIIKIRVAGAEHKAFSRWAESFTAQKQSNYKSRLVTNVLAAYNGAAPLVASILIFAVAASSHQAGLTTGDFLAFNLAFIQFMVAWTMLGGTMLVVLPLIPVYDRLRPILDALPEVDQVKLDPGELSGAIDISHVSFRYNEKGPLVLKDVSLHINPGEFVALVGPSGSGKSTMLRLLLGFEQPESGGVYYDDQDLKDLDVRSVRRQLGVVLQNASLMPQDIFANIVGSSPELSLDDAWEAAEMAGLSEDIKRMPMGMNTVISERGGNFSGGQRQRLMIARALVNKPRLIFFDEATSALDNRTQDIVSRSLEKLQTTRVVIAHRLSTIINADRIFVFENGRIVQTGTYQELVKAPGPFAELAKRQMA